MIPRTPTPAMTKIAAFLRTIILCLCNESRQKAALTLDCYEIRSNIVYTQQIRWSDGASSADLQNWETSHRHFLYDLPSWDLGSIQNPRRLTPSSADGSFQLGVQRIFCILLAFNRSLFSENNCCASSSSLLRPLCFWQRQGFCLWILECSQPHI